MPLQSESSSRGSSFKISSYGGHTRNFLFVDHSDLSSWWLFEGFDRLILKEHDLRAEAGRNDKRVISTIFEVVTADTDGDHRPTETDRVSAFFTGADGKKPFEIVSPSDRILSVDQVSDNEVLIIYQRGSAVTSALFSAHDGAKVKESALPMQNNK